VGTYARQPCGCSPLGEVAGVISYHSAPRAYSATDTSVKGNHTMSVYGLLLVLAIVALVSLQVHACNRIKHTHRR
jgi:hypothetical protein